MFCIKLNYIHAVKQIGEKVESIFDKIIVCEKENEFMNKSRLSKLLVVGIMMMVCTMSIVLVGCGGEKNITVISREAGSGTRSAFEDIIGIDSGDVKASLISDKTNNVLTEVSNNINAIGYVSLGSINDTVKTLKVGGIEASSENIVSGAYAMSRPFELVYNTQKGLTQVAGEFASFIKSSQAQDIIVTEGYVPVVDNAVEYVASTSFETKQTLKVSGSTSVEPLFEKLFAKFESFHSGKVALEMTANGSGTGISNASAGTVDIGMSSREIKDTEKEKVSVITLAKDGIAVIVNLDNVVSDISVLSLNKIYAGEIVKFSELAI